MKSRQTLKAVFRVIALLSSFSVVSCGMFGGAPTAPATPIVMSCGHDTASPPASPQPAAAAASAAAAEAGQVLVVGSTVDGRRIQYISSDIQLARITILDASSQAIVARSSLRGESLARNLDAEGKTFAFSILNLPLPSGSRPSGRAYVARVEVYLDSELATCIGTSTSSSFTPSATRLTVVTMPSLSLDATPVGNASASVEIVEAPAPSVIIR